MSPLQELEQRQREMKPRGLIEATVLTPEDGPAKAGHYNRRLRIDYLQLWRPAA